MNCPTHPGAPDRRAPGNRHGFPVPVSYTHLESPILHHPSLFPAIVFYAGLTGSPMNGNLVKIVLISVVAILLAIIGGVMSADGDPFSIALSLIHI